MKTLLGYAYKDSGMYSKPNMTGYYMGDKQSTPGMKTGGQAKIARAKQYTGDYGALGGTEIAEGKRQRKLGGYKGFGRTVGGVLGSAFGAPGTALGTYFGGKAGEWLSGAGEAPSKPPKGTVFMQPQFERISEAGKAFDEQGRQQDLVSALTAGASAYFNPASFYSRIHDASKSRFSQLAGQAAAEKYPAMKNAFSLASPSLTGGLQAAPSFNAPQLFSSGFGTGTQTTPFVPTGSFALSPNPWSGVGSVTQPVKPNYLSLLGGG